MPIRSWLSRAPRQAAPPLAVVLVGGLMGAAIVSGQPAGQRAEAATPTAASRSVVGGGGAVSGVVASGAVASTEFRPGALLTPADPATEVAAALEALDSHRRTPARSSRSDPRIPLHLWVRPNAGPLTSPFGMRWGRLHAGLDLAGPYGSPILAATDGCITYAGPETGYGEVMKITDWDGTETWYGHMSVFVQRSGCVKAGEVIARVGAAGDATGAHLHFEVHVGGTPIDPRPFLAKRGIYV
jgi:murein DD-endopeptidase MepM/ murein hydrolase activator NlpD